MQRFYCEYHKVTHQEGECPWCYVFQLGQQVKVALREIEAVMEIEGLDAAQEADRLRLG